MWEIPRQNPIEEIPYLKQRKHYVWQKLNRMYTPKDNKKGKKISLKL